MCCTGTNTLTRLVKLHRCQTSGLAYNGPFERLSFNKKLPFSPNLRCATTVEVALIGQGIPSGASQSNDSSQRAKTQRQISIIIMIPGHGYEHFNFFLYLIEQRHFEIVGLHQSTINVPPCSSSPVLAFQR